MPQVMLPFFPEGSIDINPVLAYRKEGDQVIYYNASMPIFFHDENDRTSFKMITAQFCVSGAARQADIVRAFGVSAISVKRAVKLYRKHGAAGFFSPRNQRGAPVLTAKVLEEAQTLLDSGLQTPEVAKKLAVKTDTLSKAIRAGRLRSAKKKTSFQ